MLDLFGHSDEAAIGEILARHAALGTLVESGGPKVS